MSRNNAKPDEEAQAIDLTPMLDVVFIMLIFFIVTATFIKEAGKEVLRPDAVTGDSKPSASILIAVGADDEIWIDRKKVDPRSLRLVIERMRADNPNGTVSIQADTKAKIEFVLEVANAAREAGVTDVSVSTEEKQVPMNFAKVGMAGLLGVLTTLLLLFLMYQLVNNDLGEVTQKKAVKIPDINMPDTKIETRFEDAKPEKPEAPETPPDLPEPEFEAPKVSGDALNMSAPIAKAGIDVGAGSLAFSEGEYLPIVKVPPEYPSTALSRGIEGFCTVVYTVTETGATRDPEPIADQCVTKEGKPTTVFNRASVRAALKFKYKPKVVDGKPVEVPGVKNRFTYTMQK